MDDFFRESIQTKLETIVLVDWESFFIREEISPSYFSEYLVSRCIRGGPADSTRGIQFI